jgi:hypothetical protein
MVEVGSIGVRTIPFKIPEDLSMSQISVMLLVSGIRELAACTGGSRFHIAICAPSEVVRLVQIAAIPNHVSLHDATSVEAQSPLAPFPVELPQDRDDLLLVFPS